MNEMVQIIIAMVIWSSRQGKYLCLTWSCKSATTQKYYFL